MRLPQFLPALPALSALLASIWLAAGCQPRQDAHDEPSGHGHDDHEDVPTAQVTVWTDRHEVFAEHPVPVAGEPAGFIIHVTDLATREPRREGPVVFILRKDGKEHRHEVEAPARPGIYLPALIFPEAGRWELALGIPLPQGGAEVRLGGIQVAADEQEALHVSLPEAPDGIPFLKEQQWAILAGSEAVGLRSLAEHVRLPARVRARPGSRSTVVSPVAGQLEAPSAGVWSRPGDRVEAGQVLAVLRPSFSEAGLRVAEAQADLAESKAALDLARANHGRVAALAAQQVKSARDLQEAEAGLAAAQARHEAAAAIWETFQRPGGGATGVRMELRAPIDGVLNSLAGGPGDVVEAGQALFTVVDASVVWVEAGVPESALDKVGRAPVAHAEVARDGRPQWLPVAGSGMGRFLSLGLEVDPVTLTVPLLYETANPDGHLRIGQGLALQVETGRADSTLAVPESALVEEGEQVVAYVQRAGETFEKRLLRTGIRDKGWVQVLDGLRPGERVVTQGAVALRIASLAGSLPAHAHAH